MKYRIIIFALLTIVVVAREGNLKAQSGWSQEAACPGWNNPQNFSEYTGQGIYVPSSGSKICPNVMTGEIGANLTTPYTSQQLDTVDCGTCSATSASQSSMPNRTRQFLIMTDTVGTDPNTDNHLKFVPTQFNTQDTISGVINTHLTSSIRIGDACANGYTTNGFGGSALYYEMTVNAENAMMYLYYAIVAEAPTHGMRGNPTVIIRVMNRNAQNNWVQISDSLAYYITSTPISNTFNSCPYMTAITPVSQDQIGWHTAQNNQVYYKDWEKVALNLSSLYGMQVRIEMMVYDCTVNYHYGYAYLCGECRPMYVTSTGCPAGRSTDVTTLVAPRGLRSYVWQASEYGVCNPPIYTLPGFDNDYYTFRRLSPAGSDSTEAANAHIYNVQADDFRYTRRRVNGVDQECDEVGSQQTFRCKMISSLDPDKPFVSYMYANVTNTKPTMIIDSLSLCGGDVKLRNQSQVPGNLSLVDLPATTWNFYADSLAMGAPLMTLTGDSAEVHFDNDSMRYVLVRSYTVDDPNIPECYSEAVYPIRPKMNPKAGMAITNRQLNGDEETTIYDTTSNVTYRRWSFLSENDDTTMVVWSEGEATEQNQSVTRSFTHAVEPIELYVRNGLYYISNITTDTIWCSDTAHDTVYVTLEGIDGVETLHAKVYSSQGQIVVEGAKGNLVWLYDVAGKMLATKQDNNTALFFDVPASGTYLVKIGNHAARRVVVVR